MNQFSRRAFFATVIAGLSACATPLTPTTTVQNGSAHLMPGTLKVGVFKIASLAVAGDLRFEVKVAISDCRAGRGDIEIPGSGRVYNAVATQTQPADRLFSDLCRDGLPIAERQEEQERQYMMTLTPDQQQNRRQIRALLVFVE